MNLWLPDKEGLGLLALGYIFSGCAGELRPGQCLFPPVQAMELALAGK